MTPTDRLNDIDARLQVAEQALANAEADVAAADTEAALHAARSARHDALVAHMALTDEGLRTATEALRQHRMERP